MLLAGKSFALGTLVGAFSVIALEVLFFSQIAYVNARADRDTPISMAPAVDASGNPQPRKISEPYRTTVTELTRDYRANQLQTDARIAGRPVEVAGTVYSVEQDRRETGRAVVRLRASDKTYPGMTMLMQPSESDIATSLAAGDSALVQCAAMRLDYGTPTGADCTFVRVVPVTAGDVQASSSGGKSPS